MNENNKKEEKMYMQNFDKTDLDVRCTKEIKYVAKIALYKNGKLIVNRLNIPLRKQILKNILDIMAFYGEKIWTIGCRATIHLDCFEM